MWTLQRHAGRARWTGAALPCMLVLLIGAACSDDSSEAPVSPTATTEAVRPAVTAAPASPTAEASESPTTGATGSALAHASPPPRGSDPCIDVDQVEPQGSAEVIWFDGDCVAWLDKEGGATGYRIEISYDNTDEVFEYIAEADANQLAIPAGEGLRDRASRARSYSIMLFALTESGDRLIDGYGVQIQ